MNKEEFAELRKVSGNLDRIATSLEDISKELGNIRSILEVQRL